jgi:hypothetical protein
MKLGFSDEEIKIDWLLPIGNHERRNHYLKAIQSIFSQDGFLNDRVILVCNRLIFEDIIEVFGADFFFWVASPKILNAAAFRNAGLESASGDVLFFQDSDDCSLPHRRNAAIELLKHHDLVSSGYIVIDEEGDALGVRRIKFNKILFYFRNNFPLPAMAVRTDLLRNLRFKDHIVMGEDSVFIAEILSQGARACLADREWIQYRIIQNKIQSRHGLSGIKHELMWRRELIKLGNYMERLLCFGGLALALLAKCIPIDLFKKLYHFMHRDNSPRQEPRV